MIRTLALLVPLLLPAAAAAQESPPSFAQIGGPTGCLLSPDFGDERDDCTAAAAINQSRQVAVTPDGAQVVVVGDDRYEGLNGVAVLQRDRQTGGVTYASCTTDDGGNGLQGTEGACADGDALAGASDIAFSPDGRFAYVAAAGASGVSWLSRDAATGALTQAGCIKQSVRPGERCTQGVALDGARAIALSPDASHVYVAARRSSAVTVFRRDAATGGLTLQSCASQSGSDGACARVPGLQTPVALAASADGANLYVAGENALTTLAVSPAGDVSGKGCLLGFAPPGGPCTTVEQLGRPENAVLPADGRSLIVVNDDDLLLSFARDPATGALSLQQCFRPDREDTVERDDPAGRCTIERWDSADTVAVSADGRAAFIAGERQVFAYRRDSATGRLSGLGCVAGALADCEPLRGLQFPSAMAASADARNLYVTDEEGGLAALQLTVAITSAKAHRSAVRVGLACPAARSEGCAGRLTGARAARFTLAAGHSRAVNVRLTKAQAATLRRVRRVTLALSARVGGVTATTRRVTVRAHAARRHRL